MSKHRISRRSLLRGAGAAALAGPAFATRVVAQAPAAEAVTPALVEAATKEGKVAFYTAMDLPVAERSQARSEVMREMTTWLETYGSQLKIPLWQIMYNRR